MMKVLLNILLTTLTLLTGFWAYKQNYATKTALKEVASVQSELRRLREEQAVLNAEWAYLNRPERLQELVDINFAALQLLPLLPAQFGQVEQIGFPSMIDQADTITETSGDLQTGATP